MAQLMNRPNTPIPAAIANAAEPAEDEAVLWLAFWELSSCRAYRAAPIAWTAIHLWAGVNGLSEPDRADLGAVVRALDARYLEHWAKADAEARRTATNAHKR